MKRKIFWVIIAAGLVATLSACRSDSNAEPISASGLEGSASSAVLSNGENGENGETAEQVVPITVTIEQVTDTLSEEQGYETYKYPRFYLDETGQDDYPELNKAFESYNSEMESQKSAVLEGLKEDYEAVAQNNADADIWYQMTEETTATALRADSSVVSFLCEYYENHGGAHGYYYAYGLNYDAKSGKKLTLGDVVKDKEAFIELVSAAFYRSYGDSEGFDTLMDAGEALKECNFDSDEGILWSIDTTCVSVYFEPYHLGSYAQGEQVVSVYFDEAPEIFNERYTAACEDYVLPITNRRPLSILNALGEREEISVELDDTDYDKYDVYRPIYVIGDTRLSSQWGYYTVDAYLVHTGGKNYIYAFQGTDNDYVHLSVIDIDDKSLDDENNIAAGLVDYYRNNDTQDQYEDIRGSIAFTNPLQFVLAVRMDILGTYDAYKSFHVGSNGYPVSDDELYTTAIGTAFQAIKDVECDTVDQEGNVTGKATIPAGSFLAVVRTDGDNIADLQIVEPSCIDDPEDEEWPVYYISNDTEKIFDTDSSIYRVTVDMSEYPYTVNGAEEDSLFKGIMRAG